jgi:two-component system sensor kinase FixL
MEVKALSVTNITRSSSADAVGKEHFRLRIEGFGVGTWDLDLSTRELEWSDTTRSLFGIARDTPVTYELFLSLLEPGDRDPTEQAIKRTAEVGGNFDVSFRVGRTPGSGHWFACEAASSRTRPGPRAISAESFSISTRRNCSKRH